MLLVSLALAAAPEAWSPLRIAVECQGWTRVDACTYVSRMVDNQEGLASVPRSDAQVVLYISATQLANDDLILLRFVTADLDGAPESFELIQAVDYRLPVDAQLPILQQALFRGVSPFMALSTPDALTVQLAPPELGDILQPTTTPWGWGFWLGGWGSRTQSYQSASAWSGVWFNRMTEDSKLGVDSGWDYDLSRQPGLEIDGEEVSLDTDTWSMYAEALAARNLNDAWTVGVVGRGSKDDPEGQYDGTLRLHAAIERNWFPSDDPRGNRLAVAYALGGQADRYNLVNALGETQAVFPTHMLQLAGAVRWDTVGLWMDLGARSEVLNPQRRYLLEANANLDLMLGSHVELWVSAGVTQQAIPGPADVDASSFEAVTRADYAEPLRLYGNANLSFYWRATNGARNNRFIAATAPGAGDNL